MPELGWMNWQQREAMRFYTGVYKEVPRLKALEGVSIDAPEYHYLHMSTVPGELGLVAYTESYAKGSADRQTRLKFGRYLSKYTTLQPHEISAAVAELRAVLGLEAESEEATRLMFATDVETINRIFETRMCPKGAGEDNVSCMYGKWDDCTNRPYHVYANSPDIAVAYMLTGKEITARSVVSVKDKLWVRVYAVKGDYDLCSRLEKLLTKAGYSGPEALDGNRLSKVVSGTGDPVYLPYLDPKGMDVEDQEDYWMITHDGDYCCDCTDGSATRKGNRCDCCEELEINCECSYCECCERRSADGCDECSMCEQCDGCITHDVCSCERCSECHELLPNCGRNRYVDRCRCSRCGDCGELEDDCECEGEDEDEEDEKDEGEESQETTNVSNY